MRLHTYRAGDAVVTHPEVDPSVSLADVITIDPDERAYRVGDGEEIDDNLSLGELFGDRAGRVIAHKCNQVKIELDYVGRDGKLTEHVATLVSVVLDAAVKRLKIDAATAVDLVLRLRGSTEDMVGTNPIGVYLAPGTCELAVDVVHVVRPQG